MKIILMGYMGVGKTSIAKKMADTLNILPYDLDKIIEDYEGNSIQNIFKDKGEVYFRRVEALQLEIFLNSTSSFILSIGGGTPCYGNNLKRILGDNITSIYLKMSVDNLVHRLKKNKFNRPLLYNLSDEELSEFVAKHLFERNFFYNKATYTINVDNKSKKEIFTEILNLIG